MCESLKCRKHRELFNLPELVIRLDGANVRGQGRGRRLAKIGLPDRWHQFPEILGQSLKPGGDIVG